MLKEHMQKELQKTVERITKENLESVSKLYEEMEEQLQKIQITQVKQEILLKEILSELSK